MFEIKKEVGISELISFLALLVSSFALWFSYQSNDGLIVKGGGSVQTATIKNAETHECNFVLSIPVSFNNSGKKAVSLEQLAPPESVDTVMFTSNDKFIQDEQLEYKLYLSNTSIGPIPSQWLSQVTSVKQFKPSFNHIGDLIRPGETYSFYVVLVIDPISQLNELKEPSAFLALDAVFSNDQIQSINSAIQMNLSENGQCS